MVLDLITSNLMKKKTKVYVKQGTPFFVAVCAKTKFTN